MADRWHSRLPQDFATDLDALWQICSGLLWVILAAVGLLVALAASTFFFVGEKAGVGEAPASTPST